MRRNLESFLNIKPLRTIGGKGTACQRNGEFFEGSLTSRVVETKANLEKRDPKPGDLGGDLSF